MDHCHAESLLIRIISIFHQGFICFFSFVERRRPSGPPRCQFPAGSAPAPSSSSSPANFPSLSPRPRGRPPLLLAPLPHFLPVKQENKEGMKGDIPTRSSSSPRDFTLYYVCMLSFQPRVVCFSSFLPPFLTSFLPSTLLPSALRGISWKSLHVVQMHGEDGLRRPPQTSAIFNPLSPSNCWAAELSCCGGRWRGVEFRGEVESDGCHPSSSDYSWYLVE